MADATGLIYSYPDGRLHACQASSDSHRTPDQANRLSFESPLLVRLVGVSPKPGCLPRSLCPAGLHPDICRCPRSR